MYDFILAVITLIPITGFLILGTTMLRSGELRRLLFLSFLCGAGLYLPVVTIDGLIYSTLGAPQDRWLFALYEAFVIAALIEEGCKFGVMRLTPYTRSEVDRPSQGMVIGIALSLGFATLENLKYVMGSSAPLEIAILRSLVVVPAHAFDGALLGFVFAWAKFFTERRARVGVYLKGFLSVVAFHGLYDFFLLSRSSVAFLAFCVMGAELIVVVLCYRKLRTLERMIPSASQLDILTEMRHVGVVTKFEESEVVPYLPLRSQPQA